METKVNMEQKLKEMEAKKKTNIEKEESKRTQRNRT